ncbi:hypothetical protein GJ631_11770 [Natronomonas sp. CBA1123]|uniref:DUF7289 family protein n=1 Tax=Natronomonas sp. CBA1123 TaxID=2668070 RepID=UPI0012E9BE4B|nr:hypothetical protein [Natronomonas sp. CBA1123]MUV87223.1 hypothetical protein [Natronomonas sp. CBA1123]
MDSPPSRVGGRAQSSPIGIILILGITLTGAVGLAVFGGAALDDAQQDSRVGQAEQSMTQFDSQAAQVALGESDSQRVQFGSNSGQYSVDEDAGNVRLIHKSWDGTAGNDYEIYNASLGSVVYESGDSELAYQGGGVWRTDDDGDARLVSPPEFHYRRATLTFPIVRVTGDGSVSGSANAQISRIETANRIFVNESGTYPDGSTRLLNPVQNGNMTVEITSRYCEGWRNYFQERTDGTVSDCDSDGTVTAQLVTLGTQGPFDITRGEELNIRGMEDGHSLDEFDLDFRSESASGFNNFGWSMAGEVDDKRFEIYLEKRGGGTNCGDPVRAVVYYSEDGGSTYHTWVLGENHGDNHFEITCPGGEAQLSVDFLDSNRDFEYTDSSTHGSDDLLEFDNYESEGSFAGSETFDEHGDDPNVTYSSGENESVNMTIQHYFANINDTNMVIDERQQGNAGLDDSSGGTILYAGGGEVVTFLHVTDNRIRVELD